MRRRTWNSVRWHTPSGVPRGIGFHPERARHEQGSLHGPAGSSADTISCPWVIRA